MNKVKSLIFALIVCVAFCALAEAQQAGSADAWVRIESPAKDFSVELPEKGMLVNKPGKFTHIWNRGDGVSFYVEIGPSRNADRFVKFDAKNPGADESPKLYSVGSFMVEQTG